MGWGKHDSSVTHCNVNMALKGTGHRLSEQRLLSASMYRGDNVCDRLLVFDEYNKQVPGCAFVCVNFVSII